MTTHLSVRLAWHDRGWDGRICDAPQLNASCIVQQHIREGRDDVKERSAAGIALSELDWLPPCSRDTGAFSPVGFVVTHNDPLEGRGLPSVDEGIPPHSCCPSPYRWMREENFRAVCEAENLQIRGPDSPKDRGWVYEPDRQRALLDNFWGKLEAGGSLIFYYVNQGNPIDEAASRILVGVGRLKELGPQLYFGTKKNFEDQYPVWSRRVTQSYPAQGVRIPYQEYLRAGYPVEAILCRVPQSHLVDFSYVGEHVSDDVALVAVERIIQSIERVKSDGLVPGDWDDSLDWLDEVLAELWRGRGPFPGMGGALQYLGFSNGTAYHRFVLTPLVKQGIDPWARLREVLDGHREPEKDYRSGLLKAREKWQALKSKHELLATLVRFELDRDQVERVANPDLRLKCGILATEEDIVANPYVLSELDAGTVDSSPIGLETIDHGMAPEGDAALFKPVDTAEPDDRRRVRATAASVLEDAAQAGDTLLPLPVLLDRIAVRFPDRRACRPDRELVAGQEEFLRGVLWTAFDVDPPLAALKHLRELEQHAAGVIKRRSGKTNAVKEPTNWRMALEREFGKPTNEREKSALAEKDKALETLYERRISVLTGGAGTGKTSVLKVFLAELERLEGAIPILLLAPTGKARVRLATKTGRKAMTIHQLLLKQGWLRGDTFQLKEKSEKAPFAAAPLVIIDECSMISTDLFGTLLKALDMNGVTRLILVGDPNQLPPIGPGRPFVDIIEWFTREAPASMASLTETMRTTASGEASRGLQLAEGYRATRPHPADDELLAAIAKGGTFGDLTVGYWKGADDLQAKLNTALGTQLGFKNGDYQAFNASLGIAEKAWERCEAWQILSPTRAQHFGTDDLNRRIQRQYKGGLIRQASNPWSKSPRPFGEMEIVWTDKVIQIRNRGHQAWPRESGGLDYVANGEIGVVTQATKSGKAEYVDVSFSTQPGFSYRFFRGEIDDNLELAYALTVHKAQGSDFDTVFFILPKEASTLSRELVYTGLTRFRGQLVLLVEEDLHPLLRLRAADSSATRLRNTQMFELLLRPEGVTRPHLEALIHRTRLGVAVRSKSEVVVADTLQALGISYKYEEPLFARKHPKDFRLPDFTVSFEGDIYYWEHLGMLSVPSYRQAWERKLTWYRDNGFDAQLITSEDGPDGSIDARVIEAIARERILGE